MPVCLLHGSLSLIVSGGLLTYSILGLGSHKYSMSVFWLPLWLVLRGSTYSLSVFWLPLWLVLEGTVCLFIFWLQLWLALRGTDCLSVFWLSLWLVLGGRVCLSFFWLPLWLVLKAQSVCLSSDCYYDLFLKLQLSMFVCLLTAIFPCSWSFSTFICLSSDCYYDWFLKVQNVSLPSVFYYDLFFNVESVFLSSDCHCDLFLNIQYFCLSSDCHYALFLKLQYICLSVFRLPWFLKVQSVKFRIWLLLWLVLECTICLSVFFWLPLSLVLEGLSVFLMYFIMACSRKSVCLSSSVIMTCSWDGISVCLLTSFRTGFSQGQFVCLSSDFWYELFLKQKYLSVV